MSPLADFLQSYFFPFLAYVGIALQITAIALLLRGPVSRYLILMVYILTMVGTTVVEMWARTHMQPPEYMKVYFTNEIATDLLLFLVVILFTYRTVEAGDGRTSAGKLLTLVVVIVMVLPFVIFREPKFHNLWYRHTSQLLNFGAAIMNVVLWTALLKSKRRDPLLVTLSIGVGIMVTGWAIYFGLSLQLGPNLRLIANLIAVSTNLLGMYVWCRGLYRAQKSQAPPRPPESLPTPTPTVDPNPRLL